MKLAAQSSPVIRIANCSGFYGDRLTAAREMVEDGPIDVLSGDWLAELTMLILARNRQKRPDGGFARTFVTQMEQVMGACLDRGIKVVSNAGGLDPEGCATAVAAIADELGLSPSIAYIDGDDLMGRIHELVAGGDLLPVAGGELGDPARYLTANAYLGCWGIVDALRAGADIVIAGRVTDAAVTCGPAAWHHGWARDDWDALAGAVVAGHVIECGAQASGGNYSFFAEIPGYDGAGARLGFPWAEIAADGSSVIGKHEPTGGIVNIGTVTSQLLYEIGGPAYLGPDVTARFDTIQLEEVGSDRVRITGARGGPPPPTLKVGINELGGYRNSVEIALTGMEIESKHDFAQAAFWDACRYAPSDFDSVTSRLVRTDKPDPASNEEATAIWRLTVKDRDEAKVGRAFSNAFVETALASIPGMYALAGGPTAARPFGVYRPAALAAALVPQYVHLMGGPQATISSVAPSGPEPDDPTPVVRPDRQSRRFVDQPHRSVALGTIVGTRSGDKGGDANLGVFARSAEAWEWLESFLTCPQLAELLPEVAAFPVERYSLPNLWSLNFVIRGLLEEGVAASTRRDPQAKSLGEWLRARVVAIPESLLEESE